MYICKLFTVILIDKILDPPRINIKSALNKDKLDE